jgi:cytochrome d ubiquinol oxidase subunit II
MLLFGVRDIHHRPAVPRSHKVFRLLPSSSDPVRDITIQNALSGPHALQVGLVWWAFGMIMALTYLVIVYRMFRGKVSLEGGGYGP